MKAGEIRSIDVKNGLVYKNAPPFGLGSVKRGGHSYNSARRRRNFFEVFSDQMKGKRVLGGVWAPQARKKFRLRR